MKNAIVMPAIVPTLALLAALAAASCATAGKGGSSPANGNSDSIVMTTPETAEDFLNRGIVFALRGDYELAIADFTDALALEPQMNAAYLLRGRAFYTGASEVYTVKENFSSTIINGNGGKFTAEQGQAYDKAIADYNQAIKIDPDNAAAYTERGVVYSQKGDHDKAFEDYNRAIRIDVNYAPAYYGRGRVYGAKKDYDKAIVDYSQTIQVDPKFTPAYFNRGNAYATKKDYDKAIADYSQALRITPNDADIYNNRGNAYDNKGDYDKAIADYEAALRINPNHAIAKNNLEIARRKRGR